MCNSTDPMSLCCMLISWLRLGPATPRSQPSMGHASCPSGCRDRREAYRANQVRVHMSIRCDRRFVLFGLLKTGGIPVTISVPKPCNLSFAARQSHLQIQQRIQYIIYSKTSAWRILFLLCIMGKFRGMFAGRGTWRRKATPPFRPCYPSRWLSCALFGLAPLRFFRYCLRLLT